MFSLKRSMLAMATASALLLNSGVAGVALAQEDPNLIIMQDNLFLIPEHVVQVGTTVTWYNADVEQHDVVERYNLLFISPLINQGEWWQLTFDTPGTYAYVCDLHANMEAVITVVEAPPAPEAAM